MEKPEKSKSFSVLIPDGESIFALKVLACLGAIKKIKVYILSNDLSAKVRYSRYCSSFITYSETNDSDRLTAIIDTIQKTNVDVVLPVDIKTIRLISANRQEIEKITRIVPLPEIGSIDIADDKWLSFNWMHENNIACPPTLLYNQGEDFEEELARFTFPVIIKPRKGSGGEGIEIFENLEAFLNFPEKNINAGEVIVQAFIKGFDIDCSILCKEGEILAYTIQKRFIYNKKPVYGELGIDFVYHESTLDIVKDLAKKFNWSGIAHIDLRFDETEQAMKVIEMNPRFWASVTYSIFAGVNFPYLDCLFALNYKLPKIGFYSKRLIQLRSAIKILIQRILEPKRKDLYFDHIFLNQISLKDPLPHLIPKYRRMFKKKN